MIELRERSKERIARRAHELYLNGGCEPGKDVGTLAEATGSSACESVEKAAKTSAAHYFELRYAWPE
jgi:hypothetical protein